MSSAAVGAGFVLSGRYRLVEPLASGGMGTVWRALDLLLDRPVAVKEVRLPPSLDDDSRQLMRRRTIREAQVAARLRHPAVVTIFDVVEQDGRPWIVMELVPSRSLAEIIRDDGPLPPAKVAAIGLRVLDAMVAAAAAGVSHRDIKPANVLVTYENRVVLTDFGIARHVGDETLTSAGLIVGSPDYLAPERARGRPGGLSADLWSLGATMYDAVEGRRPFERNGPLPTLAAVVMDEPDPPQRAGPLRPVIDGLLIKDPAHRLDADRTRSMLQRVLRGRPAGGTVPFPRRPPDDTPPPAPEPPPEPPAVIPLKPTAAEPIADRSSADDSTAVDGDRRYETLAQEAPGRTAETTGGAEVDEPRAETTGGAGVDEPTVETAAGRASAPSGGAAGGGGTTDRPTGGAVAAGPDGPASEPADAPAAGRSPTRGTGALPGAPAGGRRRRAMLVGLVVLVLAGVAAVLVPAVRNDPGDDPGPASGATAGPAASAPPAGRTTTTASGAAPSRPSTAAPTTPAPTRTTTTSSNPPATGAEVAAPAGFTRYTDPIDGFSLVVPAGWRPVRSETLVDFDDPTSSRFLRIDTSDHALPDPYQNWIDYEHDFRQGKPDYRRITIRRVPDYRPEEGWTTADWEFMLGSTHVLDRNIRVNAARAHAIYWSTPQSQWDTAGSRRILQLAEQSFVPAPTGG